MADQRDQPRASGSRGPHRDIPPSSSSGRTKDADSTRRDHQDTVDEAASARAEPASERSEDEDGYEVEAILDEKKDKHGRTLYYIKWKGWDESWNEWIPHEDTSCPELIAEFRRSKLKKRKKEKKLKSEDSQTPRKRRTPDNAAEEQEDTAGSSRASNGATQQASKSKPSAAIVNRCRNPPDEETMALDRLRPYPPSDSVSKPPRPPSPSPPMSVVEAPVPEPVVAEPIPVKVLTQRSTNIGDAFYCVLWSDGVETWERINHMNKYVDLLIEFETAGPRKDRRERTTVPFSVNAPSRLGGSAGSQRQTAANPLSKKSAPDSVQKKADPRALSKGASPKPFPKRAGSPAGTPAKAPLPKRHKSLPISYESDDEDQAAQEISAAKGRSQRSSTAIWLSSRTRKTTGLLQSGRSLAVSTRTTNRILMLRCQVKNLKETVGCSCWIHLRSSLGQVPARPDATLQS
ncbi:uncharacterized protein BJ171DRAFT_222270 [Polychytrium aggregatum]|uniref:uncharacterized protein n=1 Tax=Polychytrium aggregatum TaxID=110093 RepID=UPI0022FF40CD|nr:uncharacterized protein BJ171DRAFT_222270 [Polychytrium aggregatum]KAI9197526.1 hypothetical protein BJ171DRAFT_222270 [Polychytrium aggregatum]